MRIFVSNSYWELNSVYTWTNKTHITKTRIFKYIENFISKNWKFSDKKNSDIFHISAQNIDCGYSLEPPRRGGSNEYPQSMVWAEIRKPQFYYIKVGFKGVKIILVCFRDEITALLLKLYA